LAQINGILPIFIRVGHVSYVTFVVDLYMARKALRPSSLSYGRRAKKEEDQSLSSIAKDAIDAGEIHEKDIRDMFTAVGLVGVDGENS